MNLHKYLITYDTDVIDPNTRRSKVVNILQVKRDAIMLTISEFKDLVTRGLSVDEMVERIRQ